MSSDTTIAIQLYNTAKICNDNPYVDKVCYLIKNEGYTVEEAIDAIQRIKSHSWKNQAGESISRQSVLAKIKTSDMDMILDALILKGLPDFLDTK